MGPKIVEAPVARDGDAVSPVESMIAAAFAEIRQLEGSRLFPDGLGSVEVNFTSGDGAQMAIKLQAPLKDEASPDDVRILLEGDVEATFNAEGHHVIALIAQKDLSKRFPNTMKKVQKILDNGHRDLLSAAVFPDVIRNSQPLTKPFHFVDFEFRDGGPARPPLPPAPHVISKIADLTGTLKQGGSAQVMVDALSWLIHLVGDVHQPLHCITHVTAQHLAPEGDRGGNSFKLKGAGNLHSVWDSSVSFTSQDEQKLADSIAQEHPRGRLAAELRVTDVEKWARAGYDLAKQVAYGPLHEDAANPPTLSSAYLKKAEETGRRQAALAGYRLADRLQLIFG